MEKFSLEFLPELIVIMGGANIHVALVIAVGNSQREFKCMGFRRKYKKLLKKTSSENIMYRSDNYHFMMKHTMENIKTVYMPL